VISNLFLRHDDIADLIGLPALPFKVMFPDKAKEFKCSLLEYVEILFKQFVGPGAPSTTTGHTGVTGTDESQAKGTLEIHSSGYPVAPRTNKWKKVTRNDLEPLYRMYITEHYRKCYYLY
jgi:hypothetical protein